MRACINGRIYDTGESERITGHQSADGDDELYRTADGRFFLETISTFVDGRKLAPWESVEDVDEELDPATTSEWGETSRLERKRRVRFEKRLLPLTHREALIWCIKTHIPECFRGALLESL